MTEIATGDDERGRTVRAEILLGNPPASLAENLNRLVSRVVVDVDVLQPSMFEITFTDPEDELLTSSDVKIGTPVEIRSGAGGPPLITDGEVTGIEAECRSGTLKVTRLRGYTKAHRLLGRPRSEVWTDVFVEDVVKMIGKRAGLKIGTLDSTRIKHKHIGQFALSDWDFLRQLAVDVGFEVGVSDGELYFRRPEGAARSGGFTSIAAAGAAAQGLDEPGVPNLVLGDNLFWFNARITGAGLSSKVEVRGWDGKSATTVVSKTETATGSVNLGKATPAKVAGIFEGGMLPGIAAIRSAQALMPGDMGDAPDPHAHVVVNRPLANGGPGVSGAADEKAAAVADHVGSTFCEADGKALGDAAIRAGHKIRISEVQPDFCGTYVVTQVSHVFDEMYETTFRISGQQDRSLLGLTSGGRNSSPHRSVSGLVPGIVTNCADPWKHNRVKVSFPWLSPGFESDWARVIQVGAGHRSGLAFLPEPGDEVLVGFEFDDPQRPYVLGGLINDRSFKFASGAVEAKGQAAEVVNRGLVAPSGNGLRFEDRLPPAPPGSSGPGGPPNTSVINLGTEDGKLGLKIDQVNGTIDLTCQPAAPNSKSATGQITINCPPNGSVSVNAGPGGTIKVEGGNVTVEAKQALVLKGTTVDIQGTGETTITGKFVKLN